MKTLLISLAMLGIGVGVGIAIMKYENRCEVVPPQKTAAAPAAHTTPPGIDEWDPFEEMRRMQQAMDRAFNNSIALLHQKPPFNGFPSAPGYSLSLDVREFKDRFEIHAALPDAKASDVNVKLEDDRTLTVEVNNKAKNTTNSTGRQGSSSTTTEQWGQYSQTIRLPSAVQTHKMKVEHKDHELLITLPKAPV